MFGISVTGKMRFGQHRQTRDAAFAVEFMPVDFADGFQTEIGNDA